MVPRQSPRVIAQRLLVIALLAAVFCVSAGVVTYLALQGRTVEVPNLVGKSEGEAEGALAEQGLRMQVRNRAPGSQATAGVVRDQSPAAGTTVKTGQLVRVSLAAAR